MIRYSSRNVTLLSPHPRNQEQVIHPFATQHPNEMISDSVELWDTHVCFLHIQLIRTNVRLPKIHKILPKLILTPQGRQQNLSLGINPIDNAGPCYPHDSIVGGHLCDECMKSCPFVTVRARLFADQRMSGLPNRARYKHYYKTIHEQTSDDSPTDPSSSILKW